jgi:hypothetical protein
VPTATTAESSKPIVTPVETAKPLVKTPPESSARKAPPTVKKADPFSRRE